MVISAMGWAVLNEKDSHAGSRSRRKSPIARRFALAALEQMASIPSPFRHLRPRHAGRSAHSYAHISNHDLAHDVLAHVGVFLACVVLSIAVYFCYAYAPASQRHTAVDRARHPGVIAFIVVCIGVQIAWNGLSVLLSSLKHA